MNPLTEAVKAPGMNWSGSDLPGYKAQAFNTTCEQMIRDGRKVPNMNFHEFEKTGKPGRSFQSAAVEGIKNKDADGYERNHPEAFGWKSPRTSSGATQARKAASAMIAKIPFELSNWIARSYMGRYNEGGPTATNGAGLTCEPLEGSTCYL